MNRAAWRNHLLKLTRVHFGLAMLYGVATAAFEAWQLLAPQALTVRWFILAGLLLITFLVGYGGRQPAGSSRYYQKLIGCLIAMDILFASVSLYTERGMASRAVILYSLPIIIAAIFKRRAALFVTAGLSAAAYSLTAIWYSVIHPSEGYKIEVYGVVGFYCAIFFILAGLLALLPNRTS